MSKINIFDYKAGMITINRSVILTFPSFKKILTRDKDQRKTKAFKEFAYIYHMADGHSLPNRSGYDPKESHTYAVAKSGLDKGFKPDIPIVNAIRDYKDEEGNVAKDNIIELLKTFRFIGVVVKKVRKTLEAMLDVPALSHDTAVQILNLIKLLIAEAKEIPVITRELKKAITELEIDSGVHDVAKIRGTDEEVPGSADPSTDY